jgi:DNA repair protein RadC
LGAVFAAEEGRLRQAIAQNDRAVLLLKAVDAAIRRVVREPIEKRPLIDSYSALMNYLSVSMRHNSTECLRVLFLDMKNGLMHEELHQRGTVNQVPLYTRELVKSCLEVGASSIIIVHNHLSDIPKPSLTDIKTTREVISALKTINVRVHDHVIIGRTQEISFRKLKLIRG